jgi:hypothetical protein
MAYIFRVEEEISVKALAARFHAGFLFSLFFGPED